VLWRCLLPLVAISVATTTVEAQTSSGLPLPPGAVISGPIFRRDGTTVPSITSGADANAYLRLTPPTDAFTPVSPALVVRTTAPTQYVRFFTQGVTNPVGGFIVGSNAVRGLNAAQVRDVLALPFLPDSLTIVQVPVSTCMIIGQAAPILGNFPADPAHGIPAPGPWGHGGAIQDSLVGISSNPGCANPQFVPSADFVNQQPIGAAALSYRPRAGLGNPLAVATALDTATPPALFSDMDGIYNSLDLINIGNPAPLRSALAQLDGEAYADTATVEIDAARMFLGSVDSHIRLDRKAPASGPPVQQWLTGFGAAGGIGGTGDRHGFDEAMGGMAGGIEHHFDPGLLAGIALGYTAGSYGTNGLSGSGSLNAISAAVYVSYVPNDWYVDGILGYGYGFGSLSRGIIFPGVAREASGNPSANEFLSSIETGYRLGLAPNTAVAPFVAMQGITILQHHMTEQGAGAIDLQLNSQTTSSARSVLGTELTHEFPGALRVALRAGWAHEFASVTRSITAGFVGLPGTQFTVNGTNVPRDAAVVGISANLTMARSVDLFLRYDGTLSGNASLQAGTIGFSAAF
jgi:outer membrane autotransporter protein